MKPQLREVEGVGSPTDIAAMSDAESDAWMAQLPPCPGLPSTREEIAASDARAEADFAAGRGYPHEIVSEWLKTWGQPDCKPFREWLKSSG